MKVSLEWLSDHVELPPDVTPKQVALDLTLKTVEVEDVIEVDDDVVFEIDNKSLTNRPDLWGHYGIARELATIYRVDLKPLPAASLPPATDGLVGAVDPALCTRFAAVAFTVERPTSTPEWIRRRLERIGEATVGLCVDLSNYVMFTVGQPTHVYDADRLSLPLSAELATDETTLDLLTGIKVDLTGEPTPVIRDRAAIVGLAGVMGGADSAVSGDSRRYVLEAAAFRAPAIRRASQRFNVRTQASARYEKALDTQRVDQALGLFLHLLREAAPDAVLSGAQDRHLEPTGRATITVGRDFLDRRIGQSLDDSEIIDTLDRLGFAVQAGDPLRLTAPTWRSTGDVSLPHDIVEEVARIHGYDRLAVANIDVTLQPVRSLHVKSLDRRIREQLATRGGLVEVLTYPWTADHLLAAVGMDRADTVHFEGAPAPDRDSLRPALLPNLLETIQANLRYRPEFGIFELGEVFGAGPATAYPGTGELLPHQATMLGIALVGGDGAELFRRAKGLLEMIRRHCHITELTLDGDVDLAWTDRSARLAIRASGERIGAVALLTPKTRRLVGLADTQVAYAELRVDRLTTYASRENRFAPLPELPEADFDLSVVIRDEVPWAAIEATVREAHELISGVSYVDEFRGSWVPSGSRSQTLRITLRPRDATLTADVIGAIRTTVLEALVREFDAYLRS